jgi:hypothetical protein
MLRSFLGALAVVLLLQFASAPALARVWVALGGGSIRHAHHVEIPHRRGCACVPHRLAPRFYLRPLATNYAAAYYQSRGGVGPGYRPPRGSAIYDHDLGGAH